MKWYYQWKLRRIQKEISVLQGLSNTPLIDNYTAHARLRSLTHVAKFLEQRLEQWSAPSSSH